METHYCSFCGNWIEGVEVGDGDGTWMHSQCFEFLHPPKPVVSLGEVLHSTEPFLAAEVLQGILGAYKDLCHHIIMEFNGRLLADWRRRCGYDAGQR